MQNSRKKSRDKSLPTRTVESYRLTKGAGAKSTDFYRQGIFIFLFSGKRHRPGQVVVCNVHCAWHVTWRVHHLLLDQNTWYTRSENKSTQYGVLYFALSINLALLSVRRRTLRRSHLDARTRHYSITRLFLSIEEFMENMVEKKNNKKTVFYCESIFLFWKSLHLHPSFRLICW